MAAKNASRFLKPLCLPFSKYPTGQPVLHLIPEHLSQSTVQGTLSSTTYLNCLSSTIYLKPVIHHIPKHFFYILLPGHPDLIGLTKLSPPTPNTWIPCPSSLPASPTSAPCPPPQPG